MNDLILELTAAVKELCIRLDARDYLNRIHQVEAQFLADGLCTCLIVVPTRKQAETLPCLVGLEYPSGISVKHANPHSMTVADAYNSAALMAVKDNADFLLTIEDDTFPPAHAFIRLVELFREHGPKAIVGAWYCKKTEAREGVPLVIRNGKRQALPADGQLHEVQTVPMGCTLFPVQLFRDIPYPFFATIGDRMTQDSYVCQQAKNAGYKLLVDTGLRCKHVDVGTGKVYE